MLQCTDAAERSGEAGPMMTIPSVSPVSEAGESQPLMTPFLIKNLKTLMVQL
jgi:hypothetical protein